MTPEELQEAYDKLATDHADLQQRFDSAAQMIIGLRDSLKIANNKRDAYCNQTITQARHITELVARLTKKGIPVDGPVGAA